MCRCCDRKVRRYTPADLASGSLASSSEAFWEHAELIGIYLSLRAAELAARGCATQRQRFVAQVRRALADDIELGCTRTAALCGRATPERGMNAPLIVEDGKSFQLPLQVQTIPDKDLIEVLPSHRPDKPLDERVRARNEGD